MISEDRQSHFAHVIVEGLWRDDLVDYEDESKAIRAAKQAIRAFIEIEDDLDNFVRDRVRSLKRNVVEGSMEWETLYNKYYEEELKRRGQG